MLTSILNFQKCQTPELKNKNVINLANRLLTIEEKNIENLKKFI